MFWVHFRYGELYQIEANGDNLAFASLTGPTIQNAGLSFEVQTITASASVGLSGNFSCSFGGGSPSADIPWDATAQEVFDTLSVSPLLPGLLVRKHSHRTTPFSAWTIGFPLHAGDVDLLSCDGSNLRDGGTADARVVVVETTPGRGQLVSSTFGVSFGEDSASGIPGSGDPSSAAAALQTALEGFEELSIVAVQAQPNVGSGLDFLITFLGEYDGNVPLLSAAVESLGGTRASVNVEEVVQGTNHEEQHIIVTVDAGTASGQFFVAYGDEETDNLDVTVSDSDLEAAIGSLAGAGTVLVHRVDTTNVITWKVTFTQPLSSPQLLTAHGAGTTLVAAGGSMIDINVSRHRELDIVPMHGSFALAFDGEVTSPLSVSADASSVQHALESLDNVGEVEVEETTRLPEAHGGRDWTVTFHENAGSPLPLLEVVSATALAGVFSTGRVLHEVTRINASTVACCVDEDTRFVLVGADETEETVPMYANVTSGSAAVRLEARSSILAGHTAVRFGSSSDLYVVVNVSANGLEIEVDRPYAGSSATEGMFVRPAFSQWFDVSTAPSALVPAVSQLSGVAEDRVDVTSGPPQPNGGASWVIQYGWEHGNVALLRVVAVGDTSPPNAHAQAMTVVDGQENEVQTITIDSSSIVVDGSFTLEFEEAITSPIAWNASADDVAAALSELPTAGTCMVAVSGVSRVGSPIWVVTFATRAGNVDTIVGHPEGLVAAASLDSRVVVSETIAGTTSRIAGSFRLTFRNEQTEVIPYNATAVELKKALEQLSAVGAVEVSRSYPRYNRGHTWTITFTHDPLFKDGKIVVTPRGDQPMLVVSDNMLTGTAVTVSITETMRGGFINGYFRLGYADAWTAPLVFDATAEDVRLALADLPYVGTVLVSRSVPREAETRWRVTFTGNPGDLLKLSTDSTLLEGTNPQVFVTEIVAGVEPLRGYFFLAFDGAKSWPIPHDATGTVMRQALVELPTIGDVAVSKESTEFGARWLVTFTTTGTPSNIGDLPLLEPSQELLLGYGAAVTVSQHTPGCCAVEVSTNDQDYSASMVMFRFENSLRTVAVSPVSGPKSGGTVLTLTVAGALSTEATLHRCVFGTEDDAVETPASLVNATSLQCTTPLSYGRVGAAIVALRQFSFISQESRLSASTVSFLFYEFATVTGVNPSSGPEAGGTTVRVSGSGFVDSSALVCRFTGRPVVQAHFVSSTELVCVAPARPLDFSVAAVEVSNNGVDFTVSGTIYSYVAAVQVTAVSPTLGPDAGGTAVAVTGSNFANTDKTKCRFGNSNPVAARWITDQLVECIAPAHTNLFEVQLVSLSSGEFVHEVQTLAVDTTQSAFRVFVDVAMSDSEATPWLDVATNSSTLEGHLLQLRSLQRVSVSPREAVGARRAWDVTFLGQAGPMPRLGVVTSTEFTATILNSLDTELPPPQIEIASVSTAGFVSAPVLADVQDISVAMDDIVPPVMTLAFGADALVAERQSVVWAADSTPTGTFALEFAGEVTKLIQPDATANEMEGVLEELVAIDDVRVSRTRDSDGRGFSWVIDFELGRGDVPPLAVVNSTVAASNLVGPAASTSVAGTTHMEGMFRIWADSLHRTVPLQLSTSATEMEAWLTEKMSDVVGAVAVTGGFQHHHAYEWQITFLDRDADPPAIYVTHDVTATNLVHSIVPTRGTKELGGTFLLTGPTGVQTNVSSTALLGDMMAGVEAVLGYSALVTIVGSNDATHRTWRVTMPPRQGFLPMLAAEDVGALEGDGAFVTVTKVQNGTFVPLERGAFNLTFRGHTSNSIRYDATGDEVAWALGNLTTIGDLQVEATVEQSQPNPAGMLTVTRKWTVHFQPDGSPRHVGDQPLVEVVPSDLGIHSSLLTTATVADGYSPFVTVRVTSNDQDYSPSGVVFTYYRLPTLTSVSPQSGPMLGGAVVRVGFNPTTVDTFQPAALNIEGQVHRCRFGEVESNPVAVEDGVFTCVSPATPAGLQRVALSHNGIDYTHSSISYLALERDILQRLEPLTGPSSGGTLVSVHGNFSGLNVLTTKCRFGGRAVAVSTLSEHKITCVSPAAVGSAPGPVAVDITSNDQDYTFSGMQFTYVVPYWVAEVVPPNGPETGHTVVSVHGGDFSNFTSDMLKCKFGSQVVDARFQSRTEMACRVPGLRSVSEVQDIVLATLPYAMEIQSVETVVNAFVPEVQRVQVTAADALGMEQRISIDATVVHEVQTIALESTTTGREVHLVTTADEVSRNEVQKIAFTADRIAEVQVVEVTALPAHSGSRGALLPEIQRLQIQASSGLAGTFRVAAPIFDVVLPGNGFVAAGTTTVYTAGDWTASPSVFPGALIVLGGFQAMVSQSSAAVFNATHIEISDPAPSDFMGAGGGLTVSGPISAMDSGVILGTVLEDELQLGRVAVWKNRASSHLLSEWSVTFLESPDPGDIEELLMFTSGVSGSNVVAQVVTERNGAVNEIQTLTVDATAVAAGLPFVIWLGATQSTNTSGVTVTGNSSAAYLESALQTLPTIVAVQVSRQGAEGADTVFSVTFTGNAGDVAELSTSEPGFVDVQEVRPGTTVPVSGEFTLSQPGGGTTAPLPHWAPADRVQAELESIYGNNSVIVTRAGPDPNNGYTWTVTFSGVGQDVPMMLADGSGLSGSDVAVTVSERVQGNQIKGTWAIFLQVTTERTEVTEYMPVDVDASGLAEALEGLSYVRVLSVTRNGPDMNGGFEWFVTFDKGGDYDTVTLDVRTVSGIGFESLSEEVVGGRAATIYAVETRADSPVSGFFDLLVDHNSRATVASDATADAVAAAVRSIGFQSVRVSREGPSANREFYWSITFVPSPGNPSILLVSPITYDNMINLHAASGSVAVTSTLVRNPSITEIGGTFAVSLNGVFSPPIPAEATALELQTLLGSVEAIGAVEVSRGEQHENSGYSWLVTFLEAGADIALLTADDSGLTGISPNVTITEVTRGAQPEIQAINITGGSGDSMFCEFGPAAGVGGDLLQDPTPTTTPRAWLTPDASVSTFATALERLPGVGEVAVTQATIDVVNGTSVREWRVTFLTAGGDLPELFCNFTALPKYNVTIHNNTREEWPVRTIDVSTIQEGTALPLGGTFQIGWTDGSVTPPLSVGVDTTVLASALQALGNFENVDVEEDLAGVDDAFRAWQVTFVSERGNVPLLAAIGSSLTGTGARASVYETVPGNELTGTFSLAFMDEQTVALPFDVEASVLAEAVSSLATIDQVVVVRDGPTLAMGYGWNVTFVPFDSESSTMTQNIGEQPLFGLLATGIRAAHGGVVTEVRELRPASLPLTSANTFAVSYDGRATVPLPADASAQVVEDALNAVIESFKTVDVTRGESDAGGGFKWDVSFTGITGSVPFLLVSSIVDSVHVPSAQTDVQLIQNGTVPVNGTMYLRLDGTPLPPLSVAATEAEFAAAVATTPGVEFVDVHRSPPVASGGFRWDISFVSLFQAQSYALPLIEDAGTTLTGSGAQVQIRRVRPVVTNAVSRLAVKANASSLRLLAGGSPNESPFWLTSANVSDPGLSVGPLFMNSSSRDVADAMEHLPMNERVAVERRITADGTVQWAIFYERAQAASPLIESLRAYTDPEDDRIAVSVVIQSNGTSTSLGGSFRLRVPCSASLDGAGTDAGFAQAGCSGDGESTAAIAANATAIQVEAALHELTPFLGGDVTVVTLDSDDDSNTEHWRITFARESGNVPLLVPLEDDLVGNSAAVVVSEEVRGASFTQNVVPVELTFNNQQYTSSGVTFEYQRTVVVTGLYPHHGPIYGKTEVVVVGEHFLNTTQAYCKFGVGRGAEVTARYVNSTALVCISPPMARVGEQPLWVSFNGPNSFSNVSNTRVRFMYDAAARIKELVPPQGGVEGGTQVRIAGNNFLPTQELRVRFGAVSVRATWVDQETLVCIAPPMRQGEYPVEVTNNDQDYTNLKVSFMYYTAPVMTTMEPIAGPATLAGTRVRITGAGFMNTTLLSCKFGDTAVPAVFVSSTTIFCETPSPTEGLFYQSLTWQENLVVDPSTGSKMLFPTSNLYPWFYSVLVDVDVTNNGQDYTSSGLRFLYQEDAHVTDLAPKSGHDVGTTPIFVVGRHFVNVTTLRCRIGHNTALGTYISPNMVVCFQPFQSAIEPKHGQHRHGLLRRQNFGHADAAVTSVLSPGNVVVEVSNNGFDFSSNQVLFNYLSQCPSGSYCPTFELASQHECPRGTYCPGEGNKNFTQCPIGMYQPRRGQAGCLRCPIGFVCPDLGMHVPRICPPGFVCDVTGSQNADQPCPEGHFCLAGTATTATLCGDPTKPSSSLFPTYTQAERGTTSRQGRRSKGYDLVLGARNSACWTNTTDDHGLQVSPFPARFWMEAHIMPLAPDAPFAPVRGRYCLDDKCIRVSDEDSLQVTDAFFDYGASLFNLRRPIPCPEGTYCHPGTGATDSLPANFSHPQPCYEGQNCPEGSITPFGLEECPLGFYCPFGTRISCPAGTYCPRTGHWDPVPCPPTTYNGMIGMDFCTDCPIGFICPGFGRVDPAVCPAGFICSRRGLATPNIRCPAGFYCLPGTATGDPFRNDTTLRPMPCQPGTFCMGGVGSDSIKKGDYSFAQNCTEGFYCELGAASPMGNGLCPKGFTCPEGTAVPVPTPVGTFSDIIGTVEPATCLPGFYAPTIESVVCYPCAPGTQCDNDGTSESTVCPPGTFRSTIEAEGVLCLGCPQGTWSKQWQLRDATECTNCPTGTVCPIDGMTNPCSLTDFPTLYEPTGEGESRTICLAKGEGYFYGKLLPPIDALSRGPNFLEFDNDDEVAECFTNFQPAGSIVYQKFREYFGPLYEIQFPGQQHQGYGNVERSDGHFAKGSHKINLPIYPLFNPAKNCTPGFFLYNTSLEEDQWYPGTCEADIICNTLSRTEAQPCSEGFVCSELTSATKGTDTRCPAGYACDFGTTPDLDLQASSGQYKELCPLGFVCGKGTGEGQKLRTVCPEGFFCPTGTADPFTGALASDAYLRHLSSAEANPFEPIAFCTTQETRLPGVRLPGCYSEHDLRCFNGINEKKQKTLVPFVTSEGGVALRSEAIENDLTCGRDHAWRITLDAIRRQECHCNQLIELSMEIWRLWKCTESDIRQCSFVLPGNALWEREVAVAADGSTIVSVPVILPHTPELASHYFRTCPENAPLRQCGVDEITPEGYQPACPEFCSFAELKSWIDVVYENDRLVKSAEKTAGIDSRMIPLVYDLKHAMNYLDEIDDLTNPLFGDDDPYALGEDLPTLLRVDPDTNEPVRPDLCVCESTLRCPNGTSGGLGAKSIYDCVKTGVDVLRRVVPVPIYHPRLANTTQNHILSDLHRKTDPIPTIPMKGWEVATIVMNFTNLPANFTNNKHYQLSVYVDCLPCPPRYKCIRQMGEPFTCSAPSLLDQEGYGILCEDCCRCERHSLPGWVDNDIDDGVSAEYDNKHVPWAISITAIRPTTILVCLELLHGLYYQDFDDYFKNQGELSFHIPSRAKYDPTLKPEEQEYHAFVTFIKEEWFESMMLPLNLPMQQVRVEGTEREYEPAFENKVLIGRSAHIHGADPTYQEQLAVRANWTKHQALLADKVQDDEVAARRLLEKYRDGISEMIDRLRGHNRSSNNAGYSHSDGYFEPDMAHVRRILQADATASDSTTDAVEEERPKVDVWRDSASETEFDGTWWEKADPTAEFDFIALPYLPFFSNCEFGDSYLSMSKLLEDSPECSNEPFDTTLHIEQYPWEGLTQPVADGCSSSQTLPDPELGRIPGMELYCYYEEDVYNPAANKRWFERETGEAFVSISKEPIAYSEYMGLSEDNEPWGRGANMALLKDSDDVLEWSLVEGGEESLVPRRVSLFLAYYQVTPSYKRLIQVDFSFEELCTTTTSVSALKLFEARTPPVYSCKLNDFNYTLEVGYRAMNWLEILNLFEFKVQVYIMFFVMIGILCLIIGLIFWCCHRVTTRLKHPPTFRFWVLWKIITPAPVYGVLLATIPTFTALYFAMIWFVAGQSDAPIERPSMITGEAEPGDFLDQAVLDEERVFMYKRARIGTTLMWCGVYMIIQGARMFCPDDDKLAMLMDDVNAEELDDDEDNMEGGKKVDEDEEEYPGSYYWTPLMWKRMHMILVTLLTVAFLLFILEFSYSHWFASWQYHFMLAFKVAQMFVDLALAETLRENLLISPLMVVVELTEIVITMGAENFTDFVIAFFVETTAVVFERIYLDPGLKRTVQLIPKWKMMYKRRFKRNRRQTREERAQEELEWKRLNEELQLEAEGVEPLLDSMFVYANETAALLMAPFIQLMLLATDANSFHGYRLTQIPFNYNIRQTDLVFYTIFSFLIVPFSFGLDMFLLNTQELVHGWKLYDYMAYQNYRFTVREVRWQMSSGTLDESISQALQTVDNMCFSSQFFFMSAFHAYGMILIMLGITIHLREEYSFFNDRMLLVIYFVVWKFGDFMWAFYKFVGDLIGVWKMRHLDGTVDDDIAAKLAVGEGLAEDLEKERLELQALNSERFRHRFLARNRPWILQHMTELLTPRTLQMPGADGRPNVEYIRDVYMDLMNMGEGKRAPGGRDDISSDSGEDGLEARRRQWSNQPVGPGPAALMRYWLSRARKRRTYHKLVVGIMENAKKDQCDQCNRHVDSGFTMSVQVARNGQPEPNEMDSLIAGFELELGDAPFHPNLWQSYFRRYATFYTRCNICLDQVEQARQRRKLIRHPGQGRGTRADDVSSDEDFEGVQFDPLMVARSSVEGRLLTKWLHAARRRLGGAFPRPHARKEMDLYAAKLRRGKADAGRKAARRRRRKELAAQGDDDVPEFGPVYPSAATTAIAVKWLHKSRDQLLQKERNKAKAIMDDLEDVLEEMPEELDWFFTTDVRLRGEKLVQQGLELAAERKKVEIEEDSKVRAVEFENKQFKKRKDQEVDEAREDMERAMANLRQSTSIMADERIAELTRKKKDMEMDWKSTEDDLRPEEKKEAFHKHHADMAAIDASIQRVRDMRERKLEEEETKLRNNISEMKTNNAKVLREREQASHRKVTAIHMEYMARIREMESQWRESSRKWARDGKRKIEAKAVEDAQQGRQDRGKRKLPPRR